MRHFRLRHLSVAAAMAAISLGCAAQSYPVKPIRLVHGFGSGAAIDVIARPIAQKLSESLGQAVVVESRPGATGTIANESVVKSPADGYTLLIAPLSAVITSAHLFPIRYDPLKDLAPVVQVARFDTVLVAGPSLAASDARTLIELVKAKPGAVSYASPGVGTGFHLAGELLGQMAGTQLLHVPYKGGGTAALTDVIAGRVDMAFESLATVQPLVQQGRLRLLAVTGLRRSTALPAVPTFAESGLPGFELTGWHGIFGPTGTPDTVIRQINSAVIKLMDAPDMRRVWAGFNMDFTAASPEAFAALVRADYQRYGKLIAERGIKLE